MITIDKEKCAGCEMCYAVCPQHVIEMKNHKAELIDYSQCMECGACALNCKYKAISVTKGTGCLFAIIREDILKSSPKGTGCGCGKTNDETDVLGNADKCGCGSVKSNNANTESSISKTGTANIPNNSVQGNKKNTRCC